MLGGWARVSQWFVRRHTQSHSHSSHPSPAYLEPRHARAHGRDHAGGLHAEVAAVVGPLEGELGEHVDGDEHVAEVERGRADVHCDLALPRGRQVLRLEVDVYLWLSLGLRVGGLGCVYVKVSR